MRAVARPRGVVHRRVPCAGPELGVPEARAARRTACVLLGGQAGPKLFAVIAAHADGWMPIGAGGTSRTLPALRDALPPPDATPPSCGLCRWPSGPMPAKLQHFATTGVTRVGLRLPTADADTVRRTLDRYAPLLASTSAPVPRRPPAPAVRLTMATSTVPVLESSTPSSATLAGLDEPCSCDLPPRPDRSCWRSTRSGRSIGRPGVVAHPRRDRRAARARTAGGRTPVAAQAYAGHQFGSYSPWLGDGRALLLGGSSSAPTVTAVILHLKGSGCTPFSWGGDGQAAVGPMLRELIIGSAMHVRSDPHHPRAGGGRDRRDGPAWLHTPAGRRARAGGREPPACRLVPVRVRVRGP